MHYIRFVAKDIGSQTFCLTSSVYPLLFFSNLVIFKGYLLNHSLLISICPSLVCCCTITQLGNHIFMHSYPVAQVNGIKSHSTIFLTEYKVFVFFATSPNPTKTNLWLLWQMVAILKHYLH